MEDVTNLAFRTIAKRIAGPGLMFTEFVSAMAVHFNPERALRKMRISEEERPLAIQIFGGEVDVMVETALKAEEMGADLVDINMGCWVPKVCKTGAGAALLKDPDLAVKIVGAVCRAVKVPVSVKVRAGWDFSLFAAPVLAKRFESEGAKMVTLHARFAKQGFEGEADWRLIEQMRNAVSVPLIGNGDIKMPEDALKMFADTGCDGVMVGRAAISNPWALGRICSAVAGTPPAEEPTLEDRVETALLHLRLAITDAAMPLGSTKELTWDEVESLPGYAGAELWASRHLRGQIPLYIKGVAGAAHLRDQLTKCNRYCEVESILRGFLASPSP